MTVYRNFSAYLLTTCLLTLLQETIPNCLPTELSFVTKHWYETKEMCDKKCPANMYIFQQSCVIDCPPFTSKYSNGFIKYCTNRDLQELKCAKGMCSPKYPYCFNGNCLLLCPEYTVSYNGSCLMDCPEESPFLTTSCDGVCYNGVKKCSNLCPSSHPYIFRSPYLQHCLVECPNYTAVNGRFCNLSCPVDRPFLFNRGCLEKCPASNPLITVNISAFNKIFSCSNSCPEETASYQNVCVSVCPNGTILDNGLQRKCVETCGNLRQYINTFPSQRKSIYFQQCVSNCPSGKYTLAGKTSILCVIDCPLNFSLFNNTCLMQCPTSYPLKYSTVLHGREKTLCVQNCPKGTFSHGNTCLIHCPKPLVHYLSVCRSECTHPLPFLQHSNRTCVAECSPENIRYNFSCVEKCPEQALYIQNRTCVTNCADNKSLALVTSAGNRCMSLESCINGTILMKDSKTCESVCPRKTHAIVNNMCVNTSECVDFYLDTNLGYKCSEDCTTTLYTNGRMCVAQCPQNKMIMDRNCTDTCFGKRPLKMIKYENAKHKGSKVCLSECPEGYVINENECTAEGCPFENRFRFKNTCYAQCPPGTIADLTNICTAFDGKKFWLVITEFLLFSCFFFVCFSMICCFKGSTRLSHCLRPSPRYIERTHLESTNLLEDTENEGITNDLNIIQDETNEKMIDV